MFVFKLVVMNQEIVEKIKRLRISKGLNHVDMADKLHVTRSAYQRLESGETYSWAKYLDELMAILENKRGKQAYNQRLKKLFNEKYY